MESVLGGSDIDKSRKNAERAIKMLETINHEKERFMVVIVTEGVQRELEMILVGDFNPVLCGIAANAIINDMIENVTKEAEEKGFSPGNALSAVIEAVLSYDMAMSRECP